MKKTFARMEVKANSTASAKAHASYILGVGRYSQKNLEIQCIKSGNMPVWAENNPLKFWQASDDFERSNGNKYREHLITLPREFTPQERQALIDDWIAQELGDKHAYSYAIHVPIATDGKEQPHCHLMFSDRINDNVERPAPQYFKRYNSKNPQQGGCKKNNEPSTNSQRIKKLQNQKDRLQNLMNVRLAECGYQAEVDLLSSRKDRGLGSLSSPNYLSREVYQRKIELERLYPDLRENEPKIPQKPQKIPNSSPSPF